MQNVQGGVPVTIQQAIHIMSEEAVRCRRMAKDLAEDPLDHDGKSLEHAQRYNERADAAEMLVRVAKAFDSVELE